jgi:Ca-activated chloride channel family protein
METPWERLATFDFGQPWWLLLLLVLPVLGHLRGREGPIVAIRYSSVGLFDRLSRRTRGWRGRTLMLFRYLALALLVAGMARPRIERGVQFDQTKGIDIMLVLDFSYSMQEGKLQVAGEETTYIDALKRITGDFIKERPNDRLGIIGFAVEPYLVSPLTTDHGWVMEMLDDMKLDLGTAIGSAMVAATYALELSDRETRIMVVVTDGNNNIGVSPFEAAKLARMKGIRIYPVEITANRILTPRRIAAHPLYNVAKVSRGQFFQATDFTSLSGLYEHVEQLEKSFLKEKKSMAYFELFAWFVIPALLLLLLEFALGRTLLLRLP